MVETGYHGLMNVVAILRHMYDVREGRRGDLLPLADMQSASDRTIDMGEDAAARIVEAEHAYLKSMGETPDTGFDTWVAEWVKHPTVAAYWSLCEDSVSFTGQRIPYGERGMVDDIEARILCDELRGKITAAMDAGRRITEAAYPGGLDGADVVESIEYDAVEVLWLMRVNPLAVLDLLDDCGDLLDDDTRRLARRLAEAEWGLIVDREKDGYANGVEGVIAWWRSNTLSPAPACNRRRLAHTGMMLPEKIIPASAGSTPQSVLSMGSSPLWWGTLRTRYLPPDHPHDSGEHSMSDTFHWVIPTSVGSMYPVSRDTHIIS